VKRLSKRKLASMAREERKTARYYRSLGLISFSKDEARHSRFFYGKMKRRRR